MWISDGKFDESGTMGEYVHFCGPGGAWVDVPSGLGLEALAPGRNACLVLRFVHVMKASLNCSRRLGLLEQAFTLV